MQKAKSHGRPKKQGAQNTQSGRHPGARDRTPKKKKEQFDNYWLKPDVDAGLKDGSLIQSTVRIRFKKHTEAYLHDPEGGKDIMIDGIKPRNRALQGDVIALKLLPKSEWKFLQEDYELYLSEQKKTKDTSTTPQSIENDITDEVANLSMTPVSNEYAADDVSTGSNASDDEIQDGNREKKEDVLLQPESGQGACGGKLDMENVAIPDRFYQRLGKVVYIIEKKHSRECIGRLKKPENANNGLFSPSDPRVPRFNIPFNDCPAGFKEHPEDFENTMFIAKISEWSQYYRFPRGHILKKLGESGDIKTKTEIMLIENDIDYEPFNDQVLDCLPEDLPWSIPDEEYQVRRDLRNECIFTIDPATANDLDDALHCKCIGNDTYEVGVHIADASYFIQEGTALDKKAGERATSVYLVQKVIPMLPELLCEGLCSLSPNEDKLAFSVIWKMTEDGEILDERCERTIIRSCVKLSYDQAQDVIENPDPEYSFEELPSISNGIKIPQIVNSILSLNKIALNLRKKRLDDDGELSQDQIKLTYTLDKETGLPSGLSVERLKESNKLVEEFMLLANMAVSRRLYEAYKDTDLVGVRHPPPKTKALQETVDKFREMGIEIEGSSSSELQESMKKYVGDGKYSEGKARILSALVPRPKSQRAFYFGTGMTEDEDQYSHYALNVPLYTHFTSPIRRYVDIMVHRLLAASLGYVHKSERGAESTQAQASHCNTKNSKAKAVGDASKKLFFAAFVKECGPLYEEGMVKKVSDRSFDVLLLRLGTVRSVKTDDLPLTNVEFEETGHQKILTLHWEADDDHPATTQQIKMFTLVSCVLEKGDTGPLKTTIQHPAQKHNETEDLELA